jgi:hypothetical protein
VNNLKKSEFAECVKLEITKGVMVNGITWNKKNKVFIVDMLEKEVNVFKLDLNKTPILEYDSTIQT